jgi:maltose alpha-D-glucosyltransferase/alpha-amylase/(1->4)-alpha-D-glucan 1-alpha-D-glucosylmutase
VKQQLLRHVLAARRAQPALFLEGDYQPRMARGPLADHVLAFARTLGGREALTVVSRLGAALIGNDLPRIPPARWGHTSLDVGKRPLASWVDALTGRTFMAGKDGTLPLRDVLAGLPLALLLQQA